MGLENTLYCTLTSSYQLKVVATKCPSLKITWGLLSLYRIAGVIWFWRTNQHWTKLWQCWFTPLWVSLGLRQPAAFPLILQCAWNHFLNVKIKDKFMFILIFIVISAAHWDCEIQPYSVLLAIEHLLCSNWGLRGVRPEVSEPLLLRECNVSYFSWHFQQLWKFSELIKRLKGGLEGLRKMTLCIANEENELLWCKRCSHFWVND